MKKAIICLIALALLAGMTSCKKADKDREYMYFASPCNGIFENEEWVDIPLEVCRYTGGETYTVAYTFPDTEDYVFTIFGDTLYYMPAGEGNSLTRVDLNSGKEELYAEFEYDWAHWLLADENGLYLSCRPSGGKDGLYKITDTETKLVSENMGGSLRYRHIAIGDNGLFFYEESGEDAYGRVLKRYDTKSEETAVIARIDFRTGKIVYSDGYVYNISDTCYRINEKTGESEYLALSKFAEYCAHGGWLYYTDGRFCEDYDEYEIMRRNFDTGVIETCGKTYIPWLEDRGFSDYIEFGEKGFITYCTGRRGQTGTEYMYFKYGEYGGTWLTPQTAEN